MIKKIHKTIKILYVEDNAGDVVLIMDAFEGEGGNCEFTIAKDGEAAIQMLSAGCEVDLIFLDLNIPKVDGRDVLKSIKKDPRYKNIPVFIFTSSRAKSDIESCRASDAQHYFIKPKFLGEYRQVAKQILDSFGANAALA